jgi:hypothetical protein
MLFRRSRFTVKGDGPIFYGIDHRLFGNNFVCDCTAMFAVMVSYFFLCVCSSSAGATPIAVNGIRIDAEWKRQVVDSHSFVSCALDALFGAGTLFVTAIFCIQYRAKLRLEGTDRLAPAIADDDDDTEKNRKEETVRCVC